jgi:hypothetical protein
VAVSEDVMNWKTGFVKVSALELDRLNPRIPGITEQKTTREIVANLIEHEDVYGLAKSIAEFNGLYQSERLIVVEEAGDKVVVEGNRRLAALKLLHSPDLAPEAQIERFRSLSNKVDQKVIEKVEVVFAPSRSVAARLIVARHTGDAVKRWSPAQQAKYIRTLVKPGHTIEEVAEDIKLPVAEIRSFLRRDTMMRLAHLMPIADPVRTALDDKDKFSVTTLERLIQSTEGQSFLGLSFDTEGNAVGQLDVDEFKKAYTKIVTDIAAQSVDTRVLNNSAGIKGYLNSLGDAKPNPKKKGEWTSVELFSGTDAGAKKSAPKTANKPKASSGPKEDPFLIPKAFKCRLAQARIREICDELRRLKRLEYPNACAVLTRIFVELVIGHYLDKTGKIQPLLDKAKKDKKPADWYPTLAQMMAAVLQDPDFKIKPLPKRSLNKMLSDDDSLLSLEHLNQFVHNRYTAPTDRELKLMWSRLEPLLELMMDEPAPAPTKSAAS